MGHETSIAIDGPAASGKTAAGRLLARRMGCRFLDTGMMYRAVTVLALDRGIDPTDAQALADLVTGLEIRVDSSERGGRLLVDGTDVTERLREPEVDRAVSPVSAVSAVRSQLVRLQREVAAGGPMVMAGRDIGTVVLPSARTKIFLTASVDTRARRRRLEMARQGQAPDLDRLAEEIRRRDIIDSERADSPLRPAEDALVLATDALSVQEVVERIIAHAGGG